MIKAGDRIWIVAPHADDEVLGLGGLLCRAAEKGAEIHVLYLSAAGYAPVRGGREVDHAERRRESESVIRTLRGARCDYLPDGDRHHLRLDSVARHDLIAWLESGSSSSLSVVKPNLIFVPSAADAHQDHQAAHAAAIVAARSRVADSDGLRVICGYEVPGSDAGSPRRFRPTIYVGLTPEELAAKEDLFHRYTSQVAAFPGARSAEAIRVLAAARGLEAGMPFAEAFELIRATHPAP